MSQKRYIVRHRLRLPLSRIVLNSVQVYTEVSRLFGYSVCGVKGTARFSLCSRVWFVYRKRWACSVGQCGVDGMGYVHCSPQRPEERRNPLTAQCSCDLWRVCTRQFVAGFLSVIVRLWLRTCITTSDYRCVRLAYCSPARCHWANPVGQPSSLSIGGR